jgi:hypothetical protein
MPAKYEGLGENLLPKGYCPRNGGPITQGAVDIPDLLELNPGMHAARAVPDTCLEADFP